VDGWSSKRRVCDASILFLAVQSIWHDPLSGLYGPRSSEAGSKSISPHDTVVCAMFLTLFTNC
jgi:hypothetical protein